MQYYDQHLHTFLSFDSEEQFERYLAYGPAFFVATDHFDLKNPSTGGNDDIPDYEKLTSKHQELSGETQLLKGIEIGVVPGQETAIKEYLATHPYDLRLVSIHQNGKFDYMSDTVLTMDKYTVADQYFQQMLAVLDRFDQGHILTHFDYGLRRFDFTPAELAEHYEDDLTKIFQKVIDKEMALELNAKSYGAYQNAALYRYAVPLYQSLGGKLFTLGSDAHQAADYQLLFSEMANMLKEFQVDHLMIFQGDKRFEAPLP